MEFVRSNLNGDPPDEVTSDLTNGSATEKERERAHRNEPPENQAVKQRLPLFVKLYKMFVLLIKDAGLTLGVVAGILMKRKNVFRLIEKMTPSKESFKAVGSIDIFNFTDLYHSLIDGLDKKRQKASKEGNRYDVDIYTNKINRAMRVYFDALFLPFLKYMVQNPYIINRLKEEQERLQEEQEKHKKNP